MNKNKKRSFIIDFGCCLPFGHNLHVVNLYRKKEEERGRIVKSLICKRLRQVGDLNKEQFDFSLPSLYFNLIIDTVENKQLRFLLKLIKVFSQFSLGRINSLNIRASWSINKIFKKHQFNENDLIIFPSADFYGVKAFLKKISKINIENRPRVHLRFIGVLEDAHSYYKDNFSELIELINKNDRTLSVTTEVPVYARYVNSLLPNIQVIPEPYPIIEDKRTHQLKKVSSENPFTIVFPGTNRADKGYLYIFYLAKELLFEFPEVKLIVQDMRKWDKNFNKKYRNKLSNVANVTLVDAILSREDIEALYKEANLVLLPYYPDVYHYRGSGVHYEAIERRIPILVRKGVGFEEEVNQWASGWTYETKQELFSCIKEIIALDIKIITNKMNNAYIKLKESSNEAYNSHLS